MNTHKPRSGYRCKRHANEHLPSVHDCLHGQTTDLGLKVRSYHLPLLRNSLLSSLQAIRIFDALIWSWTYCYGAQSVIEQELAATHHRPKDVFQHNTPLLLRCLIEHLR